MRILLLTHNPIGMGVEYVRAYHLGRHLAKNGHQVMLLARGRKTSDQAGAQESQGFELVGVNDPSPDSLARTGFSPLGVYRRLQRLRKEQFEVVHTFAHRPVVGSVARALRRRDRVTHVADWSDLWGFGGLADERAPFGRALVGVLDNLLERANVRGADGLTAVSSFLRDRAASWGIPRERILRLGVGAPVDMIRPLPKGEARATFNIDPTVPVVFHSGMSAYGHEYVAEVIREICRGNSRVLVLILGASNASLQAFRFGNDLEGRVLLRPYVPANDLGRALGCADIILVPLQPRGFNLARFPNRVGEAMAAGRPVVTNAAGDVAELVRQEGIGVVADADPAAMARAVQDLLGDPDRMSLMGRNARQVAERKFDWAILARRVESFYEGILRH